jgi:hypothetical protein
LTRFSRASDYVAPMRTVQMEDLVPFHRFRLSKQGLQYLDYLENPVKIKIAYEPRDIYHVKIAEKIRSMEGSGG